MPGRLEQIRREIEVFNSGDVEAVLLQTHPEIVFIPRRAPVEGAYRGHEGMRGFFADNAESFDVFHATLEEALEVGDRIVVIGSVRIRGRGSGAEMAVPMAVVIDYRDGKMIRFEDFGERSRALSAAAR